MLRMTTTPKTPERQSSDVMEDLLKIPDVNAVIIIGRDGFVIESAGNTRGNMDIDALGASLASAINALEEMGTELEIDTYQDLFVEYGKAVILSKPVGDAVAALVCPDASKLGMIRHKSKKLVAELGNFL